MVLFYVRHGDKHRRQHGEYHRLDVAYQHFKQHHENAQQHGHRCHDASQHITHHSAQGEHDEDDARQGDGNDVTCQHVGEKSNHQSYRLGKDSEELNERHQGNGELQPHGHVAPENLLPIGLGACNVHYEERTHP